eukprot:3529519-Pleurochrysis_carterae.AAC.1
MTIRVSYIPLSRSSGSIRTSHDRRAAAWYKICKSRQGAGWFLQQINFVFTATGRAMWVIAAKRASTSAHVSSIDSWQLSCPSSPRSSSSPLAALLTKYRGRRPQRESAQLPASRCPPRALEVTFEGFKQIDCLLQIVLLVGEAVTKAG